MEVIILNRSDFSYKDHAYVSEFDISLDMVVTQKSTFKVNKQSIDAKIGDYVYIKDDGIYFGILENIEDEKTHLILACVDFKELFKIEVVVESFNGVIANYLENVIRKTYLQNSDTYQNLPYLSISKETSRNGSFSFDADKVMTIYELLELSSKMYGIYIKHEVVILNGKFTGIQIRIVNVTSGFKIKADHLKLEDLVINDSSKENVNKVIYYPKQSNLYFKDTITYYLLTDGNISSDPNHTLRHPKVYVKVQTYSDNDYLELETKVLSLLNVSKTDHQISFTIQKKNQGLDVLKHLEIGEYVAFIYKGRTYDSLVTGMKYQNSLDVCSITLGEYRMNLTEKLQILSKNVKSNVGNVTINQSGFSDLDGGEF